MTSEEIAQEIIDRYNLTWGDDDNMGLIRRAKRDFKRKVLLLIKTVQDEEKEKNEDPVY